MGGFERLLLEGVDVGAGFFAVCELSYWEGFDVVELALEGGDLSRVAGLGDATETGIAEALVSFGRLALVDDIG